MKRFFIAVIALVISLFVFPSVNAQVIGTGLNNSTLTDSYNYSNPNNNNLNYGNDGTVSMTDLSSNFTATCGGDSFTGGSSNYSLQGNSAGDLHVGITNVSAFQKLYPNLYNQILNAPVDSNGIHHLYENNDSCGIRDFSLDSHIVPATFKHKVVLLTKWNVFKQPVLGGVTTDGTNAGAQYCPPAKSDSIDTNIQPPALGNDLDSVTKNSNGNWEYTLKTNSNTASVNFQCAGVYRVYDWKDGQGWILHQDQNVTDGFVYVDPTYLVPQDQQQQNVSHLYISK